MSLNFRIRSCVDTKSRHPIAHASRSSVDNNVIDHFKTFCPTFTHFEIPNRPTVVATEMYDNKYKSAYWSLFVIMEIVTCKEGYPLTQDGRLLYYTAHAQRSLQAMSKITAQVWCAYTDIVASDYARCHLWRCRSVHLFRGHIDIAGLIRTWLSRRELNTTVNIIRWCCLASHTNLVGFFDYDAMSTTIRSTASREISESISTAYCVRTMTM